jgi:hypothetical protein
VAGVLLAGEIGDAAADPRRAGGRHEDAGEHLDGRGLAGAVGADVADGFAAFDGEAHVVHRPANVVLVGEQAAHRPEGARIATGSAELPHQVGNLDERHRRLLSRPQRPVAVRRE